MGEKSANITMEEGSDRVLDQTKIIARQQGLVQPQAIQLNEVEVFWHIHFRGANWRTPLDYSYVGDHWNDQISSIIVYGGTWVFYEHKDFGGATLTLGQGFYRDIREFSGWNDVISSWKEI